MKYSKYILLAILISLTTILSGFTFYDIALRVKQKRIEIVNFNAANSDLEIDVLGENFKLLKFEVLELSYYSKEDLLIKLDNRELVLSDFDLKHEKIFITESSVDICYVQSELERSSGKFESIKELSSENNMARVKDKDYHVKTLADLSRGAVFNFQYVLPVECELNTEEKLVEINQYLNYKPSEQRELLENKLKEIEKANDINQLEKISL